MILLLTAARLTVLAMTLAASPTVTPLDQVLEPGRATVPLEDN